MTIVDFLSVPSNMLDNHVKASIGLIAGLGNLTALLVGLFYPEVKRHFDNLTHRTKLKLYRLE